MNEFLKKIGLFDSFRLELPMDKSDFVKTSIKNLDESGLGLFEEFSSSKKAYRGTVENDGFELKRKRKFMTMTTSPSIRGKFQQAGFRISLS